MPSSPQGKGASISGKALGIHPLRRIEWDTYDLKLDDITIEVKASAYLQAWEQTRLSPLQFTGLRATPFEPATPGVPRAPRPKTLNAMVYVLCAQTATTHEEYDPLDISQWEFYVVRRSAIEESGLSSLGIARARAMAGGAAAWIDLKRVVRAAAVGE